MATKTRSKMESAVKEALKGRYAVWIPDKDIDMRVFAEYPKEKEGIAIYYADGFNSCAEPLYVRFYRSAKGMSIELATISEYAEEQKSRLAGLLRCSNAMQNM